MLDGERMLLAAEVVFAMRHELAVNLADLVQRRMMIGLSADLGGAAIDAVARVAAAEAGWDRQELGRQLDLLAAQQARLRPEFLTR